METPYFKRWELLPYAPEAWHRQHAHTTHPVRKMLANMVSSDCNTVLDVGCGTCTDSLFFGGTKVEYHGVDITPKFVYAAHHTYHVPNVAVADALRLPFISDSFDAVYCKDLLEHLPPDLWKDAVKELCRVASRMVLLVFFRAPCNSPTDYRRGETIGYYSRDSNRVVEFGFWYNRYNEQEILMLLQKAGVKHTKIMRGIQNPNDAHANTQTIFASWLR